MLSREKIYELRERVRPVKKSGGNFFHIDVSDVDPINASFNFANTPIKEIANLRFIHIIENMKFPCNGYYGFFKPSEEDVLQNMPENLMNTADCYWIDSRKLTSENIGKNGDCHFVDVWFFKSIKEE